MPGRTSGATESPLTGGLWCMLAVALIGLDRAAWRTAPTSAFAARPAKTPISVYDPEA